jgi:hypothetical protein
MRNRSRRTRAAAAAAAAVLLLTLAACSDDDPAPSGDGAAPTDGVTSSPTKSGKKGDKASTEKAYVPGNQDKSCPDGYPVKFVNQTGVGKIYATPGGDAYDEIRPGFCFKSVEEAQKQPGYQEFKGEWPDL